MGDVYTRGHCTLLLATQVTSAHYAPRAVRYLLQVELLAGCTGPEPRIGVLRCCLFMLCENGCFSLSTFTCMTDRAPDWG
jgi:hypothetical protein